MSVVVTAAQVGTLMDALRALGVDDDGELVMDMIEGETDAHQLAAWFLKHMDSAEAMKDGCTKAIADLQIRKKRFEARRETFRGQLAWLVNLCGGFSLELMQATISQRTIKERLEIADMGAVPDRFLATKTVPDDAATKAAVFAEFADKVDSALPNYVTRIAEHTSIAVRRK